LQSSIQHLGEVIMMRVGDEDEAETMQVRDEDEAETM
jgi:hypothetical protein